MRITFFDDDLLILRDEQDNSDVLWREGGPPLILDVEKASAAGASSTFSSARKRSDARPAASGPPSPRPASAQSRSTTQAATQDTTDGAPVEAAAQGLGGEPRIGESRGKTAPGQDESRAGLESEISDLQNRVRRAEARLPAELAQLEGMLMKQSEEIDALKAKLSEMELQEEENTNELRRLVMELAEDLRREAVALRSGLAAEAVRAKQLEEVMEKVHRLEIASNRTADDSQKLQAELEFQRMNAAAVMKRLIEAERREEERLEKQTHAAERLGKVLRDGADADKSRGAALDKELRGWVEEQLEQFSAGLPESLRQLNRRIEAGEEAQEEIRDRLLQVSQALASAARNGWESRQTQAETTAARLDALAMRLGSLEARLNGDEPEPIQNPPPMQSTEPQPSDAGKGSEGRGFRWPWQSDSSGR